MIQENQHLEDDYSDAEEEAEEAKKIESGAKLAMAESKSKKPKAAKKSEKGIFGRLGDKISAGLFKASKMN